MINIKREITNRHTLYLTKAILYRTRTEKGLEAYAIMKRLVYVAYRMCGNNGYITYTTFLHDVLTWLDSQESIYEFMFLRDRIHIFGIEVGIIVNGTYAQIEQQLLNNSKGLRETLNWISL